MPEKLGSLSKIGRKKVFRLSAERQRLRRMEKIVDKILGEDDSDKDGLVSFPEFISAFHSGKMSGLKLRKTKER